MGKSQSVLRYTMSCDSAFGSLENTTLETVYDSARGDDGLKGASLAILRKYDAELHCWTERFLTEFEVPNLEDPILDGQTKRVFKDALFRDVFGDNRVVFKVANDTAGDCLVMHTRSIQMSALCARPDANDFLKLRKADRIGVITVRVFFKVDREISSL